MKLDIEKLETQIINSLTINMTTNKFGYCKVKYNSDEYLVKDNKLIIRYPDENNKILVEPLEGTIFNLIEIRRD